MALGLGYGLPFSVKRPVQGFSEDVALSVNNALADAAQREEAGNCLAARAIDIMQTVQTQPSLLIVPQLYKAGVLYDQLPTTRTNFIPNNSMAGATGSVLPTTWASGSIPAGFTFSVGASGQATANDGTVVNYVDVSVSGTATASGTFNLFFSAATGAVTATTGQTFTLSAYATCISGDITTPAMVLQVQEVSGSTFQAGTSTNIALASGAALQRVSAVRTFNQSGVTAARGRIGHPIVSGTTYNYTIRIGSPQLERLSVPTPMIATSTGAVTRLNESTDVVGLPPEFSVSRNTTATRVNSSGLIESVASGVPRIDWLGQSCPALLVEPSGSNGIRNNSMVGANVSTNALPTNWLTTLNGLSHQIIAIGTESGIDYIDIKLSGTANNTVATIAPESSTQIVAASGQTWTNSVYIKIISQPSPPSSYSLAFREGTSGGSFVNSGSSAITPTTTLQRLSATRTLTGATTERVQPQINFALVSGSTYDFTVRIGWPQMEQSSVATSPIPTTSGAVSRAADVISASGALVSGLIGQTEGTIYVEVDVRNFEANARIIGISDGTASNRITLLLASGSRFRLVATVSASGQVSIDSSAQVSGVYKVAAAYKENDYAFYLNGSQIGTDTSALVPACTSVFLGKVETSASTNLLNDRIRAAALYTTRLSNDQLAELTRL